MSESKLSVSIGFIICPVIFFNHGNIAKSVFYFFCGCQSVPFEIRCKIQVLLCGQEKL